MAAAKKTDVPAEAEEQNTSVEAQEVVAEQPVEQTEAKEVEAKEVKVAKAGKRSAKAIEEAEEKAAKEERKAHAAEEATEDKPKQKASATRPRLERQGKNFRKVAELVEKDKTYGLGEALELAIKTNPAKFDATVELHINLGVDPRHADQNIRDNLVLPAGTGKNIKVAVFADEGGENADISGVEDVLKLLEKGSLDFDILVSTPANMPKLGKYARVLGPRGLMPNPKSGTVTTDVNKAVSEAKAGRVEYRVDSTGIVHLGVGKVSFGKAKLEDNVRAVFASVKNNKPNSVKGTYVKSIFVTTTMGPSITITASEL